MNKRDTIIQLIIILAGGLLFIPLNGNLNLFDWDELNFAESAREMILTGDYLNVRIYFSPFWEKPPLFIWLQVLSMKLFGINEFAARFPNAICGVVTLTVIYHLGKKLYDFRFGVIWVITYVCSLLSFFYFKSGIIDPWFNLFIFSGIFFWVFAFRSKQLKQEYLLVFFSALSIGLAILTKGPVAFLLFGSIACILILFNGFRIGIHLKSILIFVFTLVFTGGFWFILQIITGNSDVIMDFIVYQIRLFRTEDAGHGGFPLYHIVILLFGMFPASVFAIQGHRYKGQKGDGKIFHIAMIALLWTVIVLFSIVKTKIVHYSSMAYFPITYLAAYSLMMILDGKFSFRRWQKLLLISIGVLEAGVVMILPAFNRLKTYFINKGIVSDPFAVANLGVDPGWTLLYSIIGLVLIAGLCISVFFLKNKVFRFAVLFFSSLSFIYLSVVFITPGVEKISQRTAIDFIKRTSEKDAYIHAFYKTYAVLFYGKIPEPDDQKVFSEEWLTNGDIDKDVYFLLRLYEKEKVLSEHSNIRVLHEKNGFVFCLREAGSKKRINDQE
ncbi:MAG: glycosyltransferase family 39 protein [Bacteroidales bacterium]|jgi:4-amino-4-deoxy-L-arabinose transferase-like glycosyltransferase